MSLLFISGGLLGVFIGGVVRAVFRLRGPLDLKRLGLLLAVLAGAVAASRVQSAASQVSHTSQLCCYIVSLLTGYVLTGMLETDPEGPADPLAAAAPFALPLK